jgi:predicted nucleic acid-binding protein
MWQTLETKAKFIGQVMTGESDLRRIEDVDGTALTYAEVKAIASGNPMVIEKARIDAEIALVSSIPSPEFQLCLSVSLYMKWKQVLTRAENLSPGRTVEDTRNYLRYLAGQSHWQEIHFLWRPFLRDANDDLVLELAFAAGCRYLVTHNVKDFHGAEQLGVIVLSPREFLQLTRQKS